MISEQAKHVATQIAFDIECGNPARISYLVDELIRELGGTKGMPTDVLFVYAMALMVRES